MKYLPLLFALAGFGNLYGQTEVYIERVIPPSPNAAALVHFGESYVNEYTGVASVSIPLYKITSGDISLPVSLEYHSSGIKVEQEASQVGLGWTLQNAGGVITRQVRGLDDFSPHNGYVNAGPLPQNTANNIPDWGTYTDADYLKLNQIVGGTLDGEPDAYYYNFSGHSGSLVIDKQSGNLVMATTCEQNDMVFTYDKTTKQWEVTDNDGFKYFFGTKEHTENHTCSSDNPWPFDFCYDYAEMHAVISSWYLDRIESPSGFYVDFVYKESPQWLRSQVHRTEVVLKTYGLIIPGVFDIAPSSGDPELHYASMQRSEDIYLREIQFNGGKMKFSTSSRLDILPGYEGQTVQKLDTISVYNTDNTLIKRFVLHNSYFNAGQGADQLRLRLDSLTEMSASQQIPPYKFFYNSTPLPSKNSYAMDHWGYYNGKASNDNLRQYKSFYVNEYLGNSSWATLTGESGMSFKKTRIPYTEYKPLDKKYLSYGADREVDSVKIQAAMLTKMELPTGGWYEYNYESNTYTTRDSIFTSAKRVLNLASSSYEQDDYKSTNLTLTEATSVLLDYLFHKEAGSGGSLANVTCGLKTVGGDKIFEIKPSKAPFQTHLNIILPAGEYTLYLDYQDGMYYFHEVTLSARDKIYPMNALGGGVRVKSIVAKDADGTVTSIERFVYEENGKSTGSLLSPLRYVENELFFGNDPMALGGSATFTLLGYAGGYLAFNSMSCIPLGTSANGNPVGYSKVIKYRQSVTGERNGRTVMYFKNRGDMPQLFFIPGMPNISARDNGKLLMQELYDSQDNLVYRKKNKYLYDFGKTKIVKGIISYLPHLNAGGPDLAVFRYYDVVSDWWYLAQDSVFEYSTTDNRNLVTVTDYFYEGADHRNLTKMETTTSDGKVIQQQKRYPKDVNTGVYAEMSEANINKYPIEEIVIRDNYVIQSKLSTYKKNADNYVIDNIYKLESDPVLSSQFTRFNGVTKDFRYGVTPVLRVSEYGLMSNVREFSDQSGLIQVYLWDQSNTYLMAHIQGASHSSFSSYVAKPSNYSSATLFDELKLLSPGAIIKTYSYKVLLGLTETTDPNGRTTYFIYDDLGRLSFTKDHNDNIMQEYKYHYRR